ncbi:MAG TPA: response regulator transcription factor [Ilumatobacter sp.]|nr:response regulator transcription factor [Ilumatobacter sp.]
MSKTGGAGLIAVYATAVAPELARSLDLGGYSWKGVASADEAAENEPSTGWHGVIIDCSGDSEGAWAFARSIRKSDGAGIKVLVLVTGAQIAELNLRDDLFDDFCLSPFHPAEFESRIRHLLWSTGDTVVRTELVEYGDLVLNLETYQATISHRPLDLTYMEYELLKFLAQNPGKVFTRELLLSRVWGYEYYGGARTVDVHIRRLRAKLSEEHAGLIQTVRSVGYRFGQSRWSS